MQNGAVVPLVRDELFPAEFIQSNFEVLRWHSPHSVAIGMQSCNLIIPVSEIDCLGDCIDLNILGVECLNLVNHAVLDN